jgi:Protein of unknown function (DUF2786)
MTTERDGLLSKIRALLAKTVEAGCTEEEMTTALAKAQAMMAAYEVTEDELNLTKEEKAILRQEPPGTKDEHQIKWCLLGSVAQFCGCKGWRRNRSRGGGIVFCGLPAEAQHATWLLDFLANFVKDEIVKYLMDAAPSNQDRRAAIRSFVLGCTDRISRRLDELCKQTEVVATSNAKALVVIKDQAIKAKMDELDIHIRTCGGPCGASNDSSYRAGRTAGDRASFGRPVSGRNATLRLK